MRKGLACLAALGLVALASPAVAAGPKKHSVNATVKTSTISSTGSPPINGSDVFAGTVTSNLGNGAITGRTSYAAPNFSSKFTVWSTKGTYRGTLTGSGHLNPDGSASFSGKGKAKGGTGTFRHVTGSFTFTGSLPRGSNVSTFVVKGKLKY